jgi:peptidoglycan/xylan/chitin deacetylase (PgdA/CDA1 family)
MKKFIIFIVVIILLGIISLFDKNEEKEVVVNGESEATLEGIVKELDGETVKIKNFDGEEFLFNISEVDKESIEKIVNGDKVKIQYTGELKKNSSEAVFATKLDLEEYIIYDVAGVSKNIIGKALEDMNAMREKMKAQAKKHKDTVYLNDQPESNSVYLTFDDGPDGEVTPRILDILASYKVKGNFFFLGESAKMYPEVVKRTFDSGNFIGNHSYSHKDLTTLSPDGIKNEIDKTEEVLSGITGKRTTAIRPPYGASNETVNKVIKDNGSVSILWSVDTLDWLNREVSSILKNVIDNLRPGDIILMHSNGDKGVTADALPRIIEAIQEKGYKISTLDKLVN